MSTDTREIDYNFAWAWHFICSLEKNGFEHAVISPGARSSALTIAAAESNLSTTIHFDERGAAFYALGRTQASGTPTILICTSGSAAGNYLPAIMEAHNSKLPLLIISADRPPELHNRGANQTITQSNLFADFLGFQRTLQPPTSSSALHTLESVIDSVVETCHKEKRVSHVNMQFREPLLRNKKTYAALPYITDRTTQRSSLESTELATLSETIRASKQGVLVFASIPTYEHHAILAEIIDHLQWPCFVDIASQLRCQNEKQNLLCHYEPFLKTAIQTNSIPAPDCVIRFGDRLVSKHLEAYLAQTTGHYIRISSNEHRIDPEDAITQHITCNYQDVLSHLLFKTEATPSLLLDPCKKAEAAAKQTIQQQAHTRKQWDVARLIFAESPQERAIFLGNSLSIREADTVVAPYAATHRIGINRGVSGIDGLIASAVGFAEGLALPATALIGDLSALHDLNSLSLLAKSYVPIVLVIVNNDGGAIFSAIPALRERPQATEYFQTPHGLEFSAAATLFDIRYCCAASIDEFQELYRGACVARKPVIIEVKSDSTTASRNLYDLR